MVSSEWWRRRPFLFTIHHSLLTLRRRSPFSNFLHHRHDLARTRYAGPCLVEVGDEALDRFRRRRPVERGAVGELIIGEMRGRLGLAPASPCLLGAERFHGIRQMFVSVP